MRTRTITEATYGAPLRRIVSTGTATPIGARWLHGAPYDLLECGHRYYPGTLSGTPARRRCRHCLTAQQQA